MLDSRKPGNTIIEAEPTIDLNDKVNKIPLYCRIIRPKKNICVFTVTCKKNLGPVGQH
jgi:hypothetical protein